MRPRASGAASATSAGSARARRAASRAGSWSRRAARRSRRDPASARRCRRLARAAGPCRRCRRRRPTARRARRPRRADRPAASTSWASGQLPGNSREDSGRRRGGRRGRRRSTRCEAQHPAILRAVGRPRRPEPASDLGVDVRVEVEHPEVERVAAWRSRRRSGERPRSGDQTGPPPSPASTDAVPSARSPVPSGWTTNKPRYGSAVRLPTNAIHVPSGRVGRLPDRGARAMAALAQRADGGAIGGGDDERVAQAHSRRRTTTCPAVRRPADVLVGDRGGALDRDRRDRRHRRAGTTWTPRGC